MQLPRTYCTQDRLALSDWFSQRPYDVFSATGSELAEMVEDIAEAKMDEVGEREEKLSEKERELSDFIASYESLDLLDWRDVISAEQLLFSIGCVVGPKKAKKAPKGWKK